jgi:uncharacterized protein YbjT (DUF2867 family)
MDFLLAAQARAFKWGFAQARGTGNGGKRMKIVIIGGTGLIGSKTVARLRDGGHEAVAAAPNTGVNTITGEGLAEALDGAEVVIDVSNSPSFEEQAATDFFESAGQNVTAAEVKAGVRHHVALSVVGTDRLQDSGYFRAKLAQEKAIKASPIPYSIVHATQFFEFIRSIAGFSMKNGAVHLPGVRFQPMAAADVAGFVAEAALAAPANGTIEIGGPETFGLDEAVRKVLEFDHDPRRVVTDGQAPYFGIAVGERTLVPGSGARLGATTLDWWLEHVPAPQPAMAH